MTQNFRFIPFLITIVGIVVLCTLGFWQLSRLQEKEQFLHTLRNSIKNEPLQFNPKNTVMLYSKVKLTGSFLNNNIYLYRYKAGMSEKEGYYLLTPFKTIDDKIILIARGWLGKSQKTYVDSIKNASNEEIIGIVMNTEKPQWFVPLNDLKNNIWFTLDIKSIGNFLDLSLENYYIFQIYSTNPVSEIQPLPTANLLNIHNNHLEYAITWFSLAFCLLIIYLVNFKNYQLHSLSASKFIS